MVRKQKKFLFACCTIILCVFLSPSKSFADTNISSDIIQDTHWTLDASPYVVQVNIDIADTATLIIDPGVQVLVAPNTHIQVDGSLVAQGTTDNHIVFDTQTADTTWHGFIFSTLASGDFLYTDFAHADTAISADDADIAVQQSTFTDVQNPAQITFATHFVHSWNTFINTTVQGWKIVSGSTIDDTANIIGGDGSYGLEGRSTVSENTILYIQNGAVLYFVPGADMLVLGSIDIQGSSDNHVQMDGDHYQIIVYGGTADTSYVDINSGGFSLYNTTAHFSHTTISGVYEGIFGYMSTVGIDTTSISDCSIGIYVITKSSINIQDSSVVGSTNTGMLLADDVQGGFTNLSIDLTAGNAISTTNTKLSLDSVHIRNAITGISAFDSSTIDIQHSDIDKATVTGISFGNTSSVKITNSEIQNGNQGIAFYGGSSLDISKTKVHDLQQGIVVDGQKGDGTTIFMHDSEIYNTTDFALRIFDQSLNSEIKNNSIHDTNNLNVVYVGDGIDISKNWWGTKDGPSVDSFVPDASVVTYVPFLRHDPKNSRVPVIIIPGISGTRLLKAYDDNSEIWPSLFSLIFSLSDNFLDSLILNFDGTGKKDNPVIVGDIIRSTIVTHIFDYLIQDLENKDGYTENIDLFVFPYDWRFDSKTTTDKLKQKIDQVMQDTGYDSVDIVAHSMGGLVTKRYIAEYGDQNIDNLFFVGTPHLGAPKAFKALMYGDNLGISFILNSLEIQKISQNFPSLYELLPSKKFGNYVNYKGSTLQYSGTENLMIDEGRNPGMFSYTHDLHNIVDTVPTYTHAHVYDFAGCSTKTISGFDITKKVSNNEDIISLQYSEGDETVPLKSSDGIEQGRHLYVGVGTHAELPSITGVRDFIADLLGNIPISLDKTISTTPDICLQSGTSIEIHSPVTLQIYDDRGNHTGPLPNGSIEYGIPNVTYNIIEDQKYAYLPDGPQYKIINTAEHTGTYDMYVHKIDTQDVVTSSAYFTKLPIDSWAMTARMDINAQNTSYSVALDENGDGVVDSTVVAKDSLDIPTVSQVQNHGGVKPVDTEKGKKEITILKEEKQVTIEKVVVQQDKKPTNIKHKKVRNTEALQNIQVGNSLISSTILEISKRYPWYMRVLRFIKKIILL